MARVFHHHHYHHRTGGAGWRLLFWLVAISLVIAGFGALVRILFQALVGVAGLALAMVALVLLVRLLSWVAEAFSSPGRATRRTRPGLLPGP